MPSFDFTSEADMVALKNAIDVAARQIDNRYDFKGTSAKVEFNEKDKVITPRRFRFSSSIRSRTSSFRPWKRRRVESTKRLDHQTVQKVSGNKVKQELKIKMGIETELAKKLVKIIRMPSSRCRLRSRRCGARPGRQT